MTLHKKVWMRFRKCVWLNCQWGGNLKFNISNFKPQKLNGMKHQRSSRRCFIQSWFHVLNFHLKKRKGDQNSGHPSCWQTHTWPFIIPADRKQRFLSSNSPFLWFISLIHFKWAKNCISKVQRFLGPRGPLGTPLSARPSVRPQEKSESPLKPYKSSQDHARHLIWNFARKRTMSSIIWWCKYKDKDKGKDKDKDKDKMSQRPNVWCIFEKDLTQGYQIW